MRMPHRIVAVPQGKEFLVVEVVPTFDVDDALDLDDVCHNYYKYLDGSEKASNHILEQTSVLVEELEGFCQKNGL